MPDPTDQQVWAGNQVVAEWQDNAAATGEGAMYRTADGRVFEGGICIRPESITHTVRYRDLIRDYCRQVVTTKDRTRGEP